MVTLGYEDEMVGGRRGGGSDNEGIHYSVSYM